LRGIQERDGGCGCGSCGGYVAGVGGWNGGGCGGGGACGGGTCSGRLSGGCVAAPVCGVLSGEKIELALEILEGVGIELEKDGGVLIESGDFCGGETEAGEGRV